MAKEQLTQTQLELANAVWESGAFKVGAFKLKLHETNPDAPLSPYYISMREKDVKSGTFPMLCQVIARAIYADTEEYTDRIRYIIGIPKAGNPIADELAKFHGREVLRLEKYEGEAERRITSTILGEFERGAGVLGTDDLITRGHTKFEFAQAVHDNGLVLVHLGVALDREQKGIEECRAMGINVSASLRASRMVETFRDSGKLSLPDFDRIRNYMTA